MARWKPVPGSTDPADYPFLRGTQVPCDRHGAAVGRRCRCVGAGRGGRNSEAIWHQQPVLDALPGVTATRMRDDAAYTVVRSTELHGRRMQVTLHPHPHLEEYWSEERWTVIPGTEERRSGVAGYAPGRTQPFAVMDHANMIAVLLAWGRDRDRGSAAAGLRSLGTCLSRPRRTGYTRTYAQKMFQVHADTRWMFQPNRSSVFPHRPDGRFTFAGFTEPYPGAWPADAVLAALRGDLAVLWPYLR